jgi:hypothetical protein
MYRRSSIKFSTKFQFIWESGFRDLFRNQPIRKKNGLWWPCLLLVFDWLISKKSSPLKPLSQINQNLVGSIIGGSSIKFAHLVPIESGFRGEDFF